MTAGARIKILIITPSLECGGSEKFVYLLCNNINTELFSVSLVVLNNKDAFYKLKNPAIELIDLEQKRVRSSLFKIKGVIKKIQPAIVFTTANHLNLYFAIFRGWFPKNIKFVARESSIVSINSQRAPMPAFYNRLIKKYYRRFDLVICQSAYMQQDLVSNYQIPENKTVVIHNATEEVVNNNKVHPDKINRPYKFITVARLSEEKGIERLIHAVGLLTLSFQFYIVGHGDRKADLQKLVQELQLSDKIFFEGEKVKPFSGLEDADLFLMGSYYEGFPNVLLEAGALGIPIIAFNVPGGIAEIISENENGLLVDDNDILGFAGTIKRGLLSNFNRNKIIETTNKRFSVNTTVTRVENLFIDLLSG